MSTPGEIAIQARLHRSGRCITVPLIVGGVHAMQAVLDTGSPVSALSPQVQRDLLERGLLRAGTLAGRYRLVGLTSQRQPLPDLEVAVLRRLDRLGVDGLLGLDFLAHFEHIHLHTRSLRLVLERA